MKKVLASYIPAVSGLGLMAFGILGRQIGPELDADWARARSLLLLSGVLLVVWAAWVQYREGASGAAPAAVHPDFGGRILNRVLWHLSEHRLGTMTGICALFILAVYLYFISAGTWRIWPEYSRYYDLLATSFRAGHLHLDIEPSAALVALPDPYDRGARNRLPDVKRFVERVWDTSFYEGRFYLYWGPAPALLLSVLKLFYAGPVPDQYLVFAFLVGLLILGVLLILRLYRGYFEDMPIPLVWIGILVAGLPLPLLWMLSRGAIYEATIAAGQFFLVGGLYVALIGVEKDHGSRRTLLLAGLFWALAAASRTLALIPAVFLTLMIISWDASNGWKSRPSADTLRKASTLGFPIALCVVVLGWYNWARFGSVLQTGLRYTLTFRNLDKYYGESFSVFYALPSLWNYLFNPLQTQSGFPFVSALPGTSPSVLYLSKLHMRLYHADAVSGLLVSAPFVLFAVLAIAQTVASISGKGVQAASRRADGQGRRLLWISLCLVGSALLAFAAILFYFNLEMRFMAEFFPSLILLSVLGVWRGYRLLGGKMIVRDLYALFAVAMGVATVAISLLVTLTQY